MAPDPPAARPSTAPTELVRSDPALDGDPELRPLAAVLLLAAGAVLVLTRLAAGRPPLPPAPGVAEIAAALLAAAGLALVHEWLHAAALAAAGGRPRWRVRWRVWPPRLRLLVHDHGNRHPAPVLAVARLGPVVLLGLGVIAAGVTGAPAWAALALVLALAGCARDVRMAAGLLRLGRGYLAEDRRDGWAAWPSGYAPGLRVAAVADLPWPRSLHRCAFAAELTRERAAAGPGRFTDDEAHAAASRAASARLFARLGPADFARCAYHRGDWRRVAEAAVAVVEGDPDAGEGLGPDERVWLASLLEDPIEWDQGGLGLGNGQHRVCALRAAGAPRCVVAGIPPS